MIQNNPQPHLPSIEYAQYKSTAADFVVREIMTIEFTQQGEHLWLYIQKTNLNTLFVAKLLSKWANIALRDVGYSGLKDRRAVTYQWFSLRIPKGHLPKTSFQEFAKSHICHDETISVLQQYWHNKKLNRGTHKHNHFCITLKNVIGDKHIIDEHLAVIKNKGIPNYFGSQRFGIDGNNIKNAAIFFKKITENPQPYKPHKKDLETHSIYISTAKSIIFNALLTKRVTLKNWDSAVDGDVFNLDGTASIFTDDINQNIHQRLAIGDIHIAGILFGVGQTKSTSQAALIENDILSMPEFEIFQQGLLKVGTKLSYRSLRLIPKHLSWQWQDDGLILDFILPSGTFATSILVALVQTLQQPK